MSYTTFKEKIARLVFDWQGKQFHIAMKYYGVPVNENINPFQNLPLCKMNVVQLYFVVKCLDTESIYQSILSFKSLSTKRDSETV